MEEDTVEMRMAKIADDLMEGAKSARRRAEDEQIMAATMERCAIRIRVELQKAPPPTEHPANGAVWGGA